MKIPTIPSKLVTDVYYLEGNLVKVVAEVRYGENDLITLINNAIMYLFTNIKYSLGGIGKVFARLRKRFWAHAVWHPDTSIVADENNVGVAARHTYIVKNPDPKGSFSFAILLENIVGVCEDYGKVMYGLILTLVRTSDNDAIQAAALGDAGKVKLSKISWMMPRV